MAHLEANFMRLLPDKFMKYFTG